MKLASTIQNLYAAFGRGDVPAILELVAENVDWEYAPNHNEVPWLQPRRGRAGVGEFLRAVATNLEFSQFEVKELLEGPQLVVALVDLTCTVKPTGRQLREVDEPHIWRFDDRGRIVRFRHAADTLAQTRAWQPVPGAT